ncbi:LytR family transcriptional regulator, partial [Streptomyces sp. CSDS2]|nr:LytR family transcriptional regulator [Streptomyces sp. CSDS2]
MDAQGRGRADNIDPADQWVLNPNTGEYELRLSPSAAQPPVPGPRRPSGKDDGGAAGGRARRQGGESRQPSRARGSDVPPPRSARPPGRAPALRR